ncbi:MAG: prolyl oligopeptidase family serine peptidase [Melioribacteraceae bacterium]|nr:prolyl oligopeptidase family serine peptidase [Melioribacteraceae bacterium]MCF8353990.1 prolyl oligopeptidase family serine peptidase [Melioribacteraceae bacterium]MCF8393718.1 prolyl oligopeptidase family serine peptidase [Melioribacteraceae bacterium]MCF8419540.1 prolyl oligopeptidase family serine peptidase [Melioribacteraceae bacterium]
MKKLTLLLLIFTLTAGSVFTQSDEDVLLEKIKSLENYNERLAHRLDQLSKSIDDLTWYRRLGDYAFIDKVYIYGPPLWKEENPNAQGAGNPVKFWTYVFIPKGIDFNKEYPLIVFPHGGVHSDFSTYYTHIIKELMAQQYIVVAAEYRGSTGYGKSHYENIDYGGLENEDVYASRNYMIENYDFVDEDRVGIIGWSHGGLITLFNLFDHPGDYKVAFAGVPVSDLIARMGYKTQGYRDLYEADYHIGESAYDNVEEYKRRSPAWNTHKFDNTPLLIHTNTNDADVNVLEVQHLIKSLKADGKKFDYEVFNQIPGGHSFDRMDTKIAKEIRVKIYKHLAKYLNPPMPIKSVDDINKSAYR